MKFAYYKRLGARERRIYDDSDRVAAVPLPAATELRAIAARVRATLAADDRSACETAAQELVAGLLRRLHVDPVQVRVLAVRPSTRREELHGLYEYGGKRSMPLISVWMRTAQRRQVVAFRSFLRTLLHEVVHHLDYRMLRLADSYHTQGFYKRAESLYRQLTPEETASSATTRGARLMLDRAAKPAQLRAVAQGPRRVATAGPQQDPTPAMPLAATPAMPRAATPTTPATPRAATPARGPRMPTRGTKMPLQPMLFDLD